MDSKLTELQGAVSLDFILNGAQEVAEEVFYSLKLQGQFPFRDFRGRNARAWYK
jgi:hypothetical protein